MSQPTITLIIFIIMSLIALVTGWGGVRWYLKLENTQRENLKVSLNAACYLALLVIWGGASVFAFSRYYEAQFIANDEYERAGKIGADYLHQFLVEGSPACDSIQAARAVHHVSFADDKSYCFYLYNHDGTLLPYRATENKTEVLLRTVPWPKTLEVDRNIFSE